MHGKNPNSCNACNNLVPMGTQPPLIITILVNPGAIMIVNKRRVREIFQSIDENGQPRTVADLNVVLMFCRRSISSIFIDNGIK